MYIHAVINNKWRRSLKDVHTCRGADAGSDHYLVVSRLKLCLRKAPIKHDRQRRYNIARLKHEDTQKAFVLEVKNQFQKLSTDELDHPPVEERWNQIKATYCTAAESALGYLKSTDKTWLELRRGKPSNLRFSTQSLREYKSAYRKSTVARTRR